MISKPIKSASIIIIFTTVLSCNSNNGKTENQNSENNDTTEITNEKPVVYITKNITPEGLMAVYNALERELPGKVAIKVSTGEPGGKNFLSPDLIKNLVQSVDGTIVECNTAYGGKRSKTEDHLKTAKDHGFTAIAPVDIMDANGEIELLFEKGKHIKKTIVGANYKNYDSYIILSHFKGHAMAGFGGALKNMAIGIASANGKVWVHTAGASDDLKDFELCFQTPQNDFLEAMADASGAILTDLGDRVLHINVMNNLSVDCDCDSNPADPTMADVGILASLDPVALDQACVDLVYAVHDGHDLVKRMEEKNGIQIIIHAAELGLGNREYKLVSVD
ncbi:DUF362 domain-containing protein [Bacteroidales bacterium OttesenSCG-928-K03]|nr:DUF362 domain-containing protein [Odoribacter sp. OttesenSCG-928-L07]MDL2239641.1 DUF362 domain-containing protein [Bacteroidales bacterium OttesenSCG-928-L14]MDL2242529.1 DUF362 domain-containing protein [Bacteroidales bacterium OttesenSCG-928-K03]